MAADSFETIGAGVPAGTATPVQAIAAALGYPASAMLGTSGKKPKRLSDITASARSRPD
jgi:H+/Cl- antiporter ClcA